jgi:hypothetical protein
MKNEATSHEGEFTNQNKKMLTEASFAKLTLEGEGDAFHFHFKRKTSPNRTKTISQTENQKPSAH